ncbi:MAG: hypothetical protein OEY92_00105 [Elusimicrobiota bacterium]|nr:hypothetical protein [Elusimicrobiota bacterium]
MNRKGVKHYTSIVANMGLFPIIFYFIFFSILTYPLILQFSTHFFADQGDGLQYVWNIWWVNKALTELHQSLWQTCYLHYPYGLSLLGDDLILFNGFIGILLLKFLTLIEVHNFIVIVSFVIGGFTAFLLAHYFTKSYWSSIIAGFIFTFSNYHFAHAQGHLSLVSLEWIPLFILLWYILVTKPRIVTGIASAIVLFAVLLCNYYYFLYCVTTACLIVTWYGIQKKDIFFFLRKEHLVPFTAFFVGLIVTVGPLVVSFLLLHTKDPFLGGHPAKAYSLDFLALFIPGGHWRFAHLTHSYWSNLPGNIHESSVHIGLAVFCVLIFTWVKRREFPAQGLRLWYSILIFFTIMSLGPVLHIWGREIPFLRLPYALFEKVFPLLKVSGVTVRMMVMTMLSAGVISAMGFKLLFRQSRGKRLLAGLLLIILFIEYLPKPIPASKIAIPPYVDFLKDLPDSKGIVDTIARPTLALYYQTIHEKPMAFGYVSRIPRSVNAKDQELRQVIHDKQYILLYRDYNIRYLVTDADTDIVTEYPSIRMLYHDAKVKLYDLAAQKGREQ